MKKTKKLQKFKLRLNLKAFIVKAGIYTDIKQINKWIFVSSVFVGILEIIYLYYLLLGIGHVFFSSTFFVVLITPMSVMLFYALIWLVFLFYVDVRIFQRKQKVEDVLPDFLQITAANIRAGMPIDQSLWYAVRPRFGVLANEIEIVAKSVMSGSDLRVALHKFSTKYDSDVVNRSFSLLLVGMEAGGELGELLNKIANDIQENRLMKREMVATVQTYIIFITFATIVAAPILMGLSLQLLTIITNLTASMSFGGASSGSAFGGMNPGGGSISTEDFKTFAVTMLTITSTLSACLIAIIKKGRIMAGLKMIPQFILTSLALFYLAAWLFGKLMAGISI